MKTKSVSVEVVEFSIRQVSIPIVGISPLIVHAWSEKSKKMIADKQAGKAKNKKHDISSMTLGTQMMSMNKQSIFLPMDGKGFRPQVLRLQ